MISDCRRRVVIVDSSHNKLEVLGSIVAAKGLHFIAVVVLSDLECGVPLGFIFAFFWGVGLPTTVGVLAPGPTDTALNISVARS